MAVAVAVRCGLLATVEAALAQPNADVNGFIRAEATALHIAIWRNSLPIIERLLECKASPDIKDTESGWTALHRALYWGHLSAAALLLEAGAQLHIHDLKGRTPLDLLSASLKGFLLSGTASEVYSWGNGANYQLGTGAEGLQLTPNRLDNLHGTPITALAAAKFHSMALAEDGTLYTWGFGRGGRLGHPEFYIHSGESAVILPRQVALPGRRPVAAVAAGKHHTVAVTRVGEVFTWGSNRDGRLGYTAVDTQPTPRRVASLKQRVTAVAAANRHTVVVAEGGAVYSWGSNLQGQLGYGTSDSASNAVPRIVEAMKGKDIVAVAAAKRHTVVLTSEGDVFTWGHRVVTPRRVLLAGSRDVARAQSGAGSSAGGWEVVFHRGQSQVVRPQAVAICAGAAHSACLDASGAVLAWRSADPKLQVQEVGGALSGKRVVAISAGKYRTAAVTDEGDVYMWEGWSKPAEFNNSRSTTGERVAQAVSGQERGSTSKRQQRRVTSADNSIQESAVARRGRKTERAKTLVQQPILPERVEGIKRVSRVAVGEKHSLALQSWCVAPLPMRSSLTSSPALASAASMNMDRAASVAVSDCHSGFAEDDFALLNATDGEAGQDVEAAAYWRSLETSQLSIRPGSASAGSGVPSLQKLCERTVARHMVEPRSALALLEFADAAGADLLRQHCLAVVIANLDAVLLEAVGAFQTLPGHLLAQLEDLQRLHFPRAVPPPYSGVAVAPDGSHVPQVHQGSAAQPQVERSFRNHAQASEEAATARQVRILKKKVQQIEALEGRRTPLDPQQRAKVAAKPLLESALALLESGTPLGEVQALLAAAKEGSMASEDVLGTSWGSSSPAGMCSASFHQSFTPAPQEQPPHSALSSRSSSSGRRRHGPKAGPTVPSAVSPALSAAPDPLLEDRPMSITSSFQQRMLLAAGAAEPGEEDAQQAAGRSPRSQVVTYVSASPETPTPGRLQHGFTASAEGWGGDSARSASALSGSSWANAAAGTPDGAGADSAAAAASRHTSSAKKPGKQRKGGLSMFLSGALEKPATPPPAAAAAVPGDTPPWRLSAAPGPSALTSLRDIQSQEAAAGAQAIITPPTEGHTGSRYAAEVGAALRAQTSADGGSMMVPLTQLLKKSAPIDMGAACTDARSAARSKRPPWAGVEGASPPPSGMQPSLRTIQAEQQQLRESMSRSWGAAGASPGSRGSHHVISSWATQSTAVTSATGTSPGSGFPAGTSPSGLARRTHSFTQQAPSKWFVQDKTPAQAIRSIQTEEAAIKELAKLYGSSNVRLLKGGDVQRH